MESETENKVEENQVDVVEESTHEEADPVTETKPELTVVNSLAETAGDLIAESALQKKIEADNTEISKISIAEDADVQQSRTVTSPLPHDKEGFQFSKHEAALDNDEFSNVDVVTTQEQGYSVHNSSAALEDRDALRATTPTANEASSNEVLANVPPPVLIDRPAVISQLHEKIQAWYGVHRKHNDYLGKVNDFLKRKPQEDQAAVDVAEEQKPADLELRYKNLLLAFESNLSEFESQKVDRSQKIQTTTSQVATKSGEIAELREEFVKHRHRVVASALHSKTGKKIPAKVIEQFEQADAKKYGDIAKVMLENIKLQTQLKIHEDLNKQREELADGLHLIDFEQLKIENQTFMEKIEERNEESAKLRKKISSMVQMITHMKEKTAHLLTENSDLSKELETLDLDFSGTRDKLPQLKISRDRLRRQNTKLRHKNGMLGNHALLLDYEVRAETTDELTQELNSLKAKYDELKAETDNMQAKLVRKDRQDVAMKLRNMMNIA